MRRPLIACLAAAALLSCQRTAPEVPEFPAAEPAQAAPVFDPSPEREGLTIALADGAPPDVGAADPIAVEAEPMDDEAIAALLARAEGGEAAAPAAASSFEKRPDSQPPPTASQTIDVAFPGDVAAAPPPVAAGPLAVLRASPEGDLHTVPRLSVTFSQPMVPVTSHAALAEDVPVSLTPQPAGDWRWVGSRTLLFTPAGGDDVDRFPMATEYAVSVPAGATSASGEALAEAFQTTFRTAAPGLLESAPRGESVARSPLILMAFDQRVDPEALLAHASVIARDQARPARLATAQEIADSELAERIAGLPDGRWVALVTESPLPLDTEVQVALPPGLPSAEGPRVTELDQSFSFTTYGPLRVVETRCGYRDRCRPDDPLQLRLSNPLDGDAFSTDLVTVEPAPPEGEPERFQITVSGEWLTVYGAKEPGRVAVALSPELQDIYGQPLGDAVRRSFTVSQPEPYSPWLQGPGAPFVVLDPAGERQISVYSRNLEVLQVRLHRVGPEDWDGWTRWHQRRWGQEQPALPGRQVHEAEIELDGELNEMVETAIPLARWLGGGPEGGLGHLLVEIAPLDAEERHQRSVAWVQATEIGLSASWDDDTLLGWASSLVDGAPLAGVELSVHPGAGPAATGDDGLATLNLLSDPRAPQVLVGRRDGDVAILPRGGAWSRQAGWVKRERTEQLRWFVFDDRGLYRPGEPARIKGWIRRYGPGLGGDVGPLGRNEGAGGQAREPAGVRPPIGVKWTLSDALGNPVLDGESALSALGGFDIEVELPADMNLGDAWFTLEAAGVAGLENAVTGHGISVQEFRRPEFEVSASAPPGPHRLGETVTATVAATYYAGGGLPRAEVDWAVTTRPGSYSPPGWSDYRFGRWVPWWGRGGDDGTSRTATLKGTTDASGAHHLELHLAALDPPRPMVVTAEARVQDVNRRTWASASTFTAHPSDLYVGLLTDRPFYAPGDPVDVQVIAVDVDGEPAPGAAVAVSWSRLRWEVSTDGQWSEVADPPETCAPTSQALPVACAFAPTEGGRYRLSARVEDTWGRPSETEQIVWVSGGDRPSTERLEQEAVTLIPSTDLAAPGDVVEVLVQSPFPDAEGLLTLRRSGRVETERFTMDGASHVLEIQIAEPWLPGVQIQVDLVGRASRGEDLPDRPAYATGALSLPISALSRSLQVEVTPQQTEAEPGQEVALDLSVTDGAGAPVAGAEIAVVVVDEAVLALTGYALPDPLSSFYSQRGAGVSDAHLRAHLWLASLEAMKPPEDPPEPEAAAAPGGGGVRNYYPTVDSPERAMTASVRRARNGDGDYENERAQSAAPISVRSNFSPLALFAPAVRTDDAGAATVTVTLPDDLTRYRVMAVAAAGGQQFGAGESAITARMPLMLRPAPPRFLNLGDSFSLAWVVQNQTERDIDVSLAARAGNARFDRDAEPGDAGQIGRRFTVPARDRVAVHLPARPVAAGTARFEAVMASADFADAAAVSLPVWTPATAEAFATYGEIDAGPEGAAIRQPVQAPADAWPEHGGLEVQLSSTALSSLTDAAIYLTDYPYGCTEQIASRVLAIAALRDALAAFEAEGLPEAAALDAAIEADLEELAARQGRDGGFGLWRRGDAGWPLASVHAALALALAREKGYGGSLDPAVWSRAERYLRDIERRVPQDYSPESRDALLAYAIYALHRMGAPDADRARRLLRQRGVEELPLDAAAWLLPTLDRAGARRDVDAIVTHIESRIDETASTAQLTIRAATDGHQILQSSRRTDAIALDALIRVRPEHDVIPKLARGLLDGRVRGRWSSTQENAWALLAIDRYFRTYESVEPDLIARAWLGQSGAGEVALQGRSTEQTQLQVPMAALLEGEGAARDLTLDARGAGRLYYRIGMRYAPLDLALPPADHGFAVERTYAAVDDPDDVRRDADGVWRVRAGARVKVELRAVAPARRYHVALVDWLPAGLEVINPELAVSGSLPEGESTDSPYWWWWWTWYQHENLRDERVEAFTNLLAPGVHEYTYVARATTLGRFNVPPAKAEEMYHPETFGRTGSEVVVVE